MLNQNKDTIGLECKKFIFFLVIIFLGFYFPILFLIIIFYVSYKGNQENIKHMGIGDFLRIIGLYGCLNLKTNLNSNNTKEINYKKIFGDFKSKIKKYNNDDLFGTLKDSYKKQVNKNDNVYNEYTSSLDKILGEKDSDFLKNDNTNKYNTYEDKELNEILSDKENKFDYSDVEKVGNIKNKTNFSNKYNSFNDGKSIWDDYESVIDIMNKKK